MGVVGLPQAGLEVHVERDRPGGEGAPGALGLDGHRHPAVAAEAEADQVGVGAGGGLAREQQRRGGPELDDGLQRGAGHQLAGAQEPRDPGPPPRVDLQPQRRVRLDLRVRGDPRLVQVAVELAVDDVVGGDAPGGPQHLDLLVAQRVGATACGRFHGEHAHDLQQVVLHHVTDGADGVVERATPGHAEALGHRDLHAGDLVAVPDRLEQGVGEAEGQQVLDRLLAQEVVDPEHLALVEDPSERGVELAGAGQVATEGLLHDHPGAPGQPVLLQLGDHGGEQGRRDGQVVRGGRRTGSVQPAGELLVGGVHEVVALDVLQPRAERLNRGRVDPTADVQCQGLRRPLAQARVVPVTQGHPDDRDPEPTLVLQLVQRREQLLERQVPRGAEEDEGVAASHADTSPRPGGRVSPERDHACPFG